MSASGGVRTWFKVVILGGAFFLPFRAHVCWAEGPVVLDGVPDYKWWYGCSPTSGGMVLGYWDTLDRGEQRYYGNLYTGYGDSGNAQVWWGDDPENPQGPARMVASLAHIVAGFENGYTYGDWHDSPSYPDHEDNPECIGDFMHTVNGGSQTTWITSGLEAYCEWDDPDTSRNEAYRATPAYENVAYWGEPGEDFTYAEYKGEIDSGRPMLLNMLTYYGDWFGHTIVGYGYEDAMFQVKVATPGGVLYLTVGGMAVRDTWEDGTAGSEWLDWDGQVVLPVIDGEGVEWWPYIEFRGSSWGLYRDWMVSNGVLLDVEGWKYGDANGDYCVDGADYTIWADHYGMSDQVWDTGDFTGDGIVDGADYTLWADNYQPGGCGARVPVPGTLILVLCAGASVLPARGRRRESKRH